MSSEVETFSSEHRPLWRRFLGCARNDNCGMRFLFKLVICALLAIAAGSAVIAALSGDPVYTIYEWISPARFQQYDPLIRRVAAEHRLDPMLVKAMIWRESRFDPRKVGTAGERGLMQVSEVAANDWARENHVDAFRADQLFDAKTNIEVGVWYLHRAFQHWESQSDPTPFALAEYNAGASRAQRWAASGEKGDAQGKMFRAKIDFPSTRAYVESIIKRRDFYKRRGWM
jgi:soluble lytic murein transglycosylase